MQTKEEKIDVLLEHLKVERDVLIRTTGHDLASLFSAVKFLLEEAKKS